MNDDLTMNWVKRVLINFSFLKHMLVWDSFKCHITENIKNQLKLCNIVMSVIPGGCTKYLQPLDVSINKPFKQSFHELYDMWFQKGEFKYTTSGKIKVPTNKVGC